MDAEVWDTEGGSQRFYYCQNEPGLGTSHLFASCVTSVDGRSTGFASIPGMDKEEREDEEWLVCLFVCFEVPSRSSQAEGRDLGEGNRHLDHRVFLPA